MNLGEEVDLEDYVGRPDKINNAEIMSICQEAGMQAVRKNRYTCRLCFCCMAPPFIHAASIPLSPQLRQPSNMNCLNARVHAPVFVLLSSRLLRYAGM